MKKIAERDNMSIIQSLIAAITFLIISVYFIISRFDDYYMWILTGIIFGYFFIVFLYRILGPKIIIEKDKKFILIHQYFGKETKLMNDQIVSISIRTSVNRTAAGRLIIQTKEKAIFLRNVRFPKTVKKRIEEE